MWGILSLLAARSSGFHQILVEENKWTFGQILPMLLLASPLFNILTIVTSNPKERRIEGQEPQTAGFENANICTSGLRGTDLVPWIRPDPEQELSEEQEATMMMLMDHRGYYKTAPWLGSTLSTTCLVILGLTVWVTVFGKDVLLQIVSGDSHTSFTEFWVGDYGEAWVVLYGLLPGTVFTTLFGLLLHGWLDSSSRRSTKHLFLWMLDIIIHGGLVFNMSLLPINLEELFLPLVGHVGPLQSHMVGIVMILGLCFMYALCFLGLQLTGRSNIYILRRE